MDLDLSGKTAVVCGSTQGIGLATAQELAHLGANLILVSRNEEKLKTVIQTLPHPERHCHLAVDFTNPADLETKFNAFIADKAVHILVNNTGGPAGGPVNTAGTEEFINAFNQHLICNHILVQAVRDKMKEAGYGRIINVISTSVKQPLPNLGVSNTIRGAVANWSKTLANELGEFNITVNNVLPGATDTIRLKTIIENKANKTGQAAENVKTEMANASPMKRIAQPYEVANAIAFLASPAASYINGINVPVDGGRTKSL
ncbi:short-chain dehydrogenase [Putridiphycobacter roseus]|uniref:Short-chain dehydrogenase n=1 Tax=Putridiphycobacter roseus TaxID=2219161 RepID=A0A2W1N4H3_9FLAO|nr:SDR family oxidoreductase [Putridiphycobacter roseus]PZE18724.1 short-chain dehydrogenase [Putridiphycobacter roseus]